MGQLLLPIKLRKNKKYFIEIFEQLNLKCSDWQAFRHISKFEKIHSHKKCSPKIPISSSPDTRPIGRIHAKFGEGGGGSYVPNLNFKTRVTKTKTRTAKKAICWIGKTATLNVHHAFLYISLASLHDCDGKMPNFKFYRERNQATAKFSFSFWTWKCFLGNWLKKSSLAFDKVNELE